MAGTLSGDASTVDSPTEQTREEEEAEDDAAGFTRTHLDRPSLQGEQKEEEADDDSTLGDVDVSLPLEAVAQLKARQEAQRDRLKQDATGSQQQQNVDVSPTQKLSYCTFFLPCMSSSQRQQNPLFKNSSIVAHLPS